MLNSICPIFPSADFGRTSAFYGDLGFTEVARFEENGYLILVRDGVEIHFFSTQGHEAAEDSDHAAFVRVENANALSLELEALNLADHGVPRFTRAEGKPWGVCELEIVDPDNNLLRMGHVSSET
ncbi:VOC family protein [Cognatiyoonia sp. IB215182]|uniref:bleomycin resistance protein n=1 Tax=Cognatiyoonia sp. IB215182 TaxID=3097353 RepID=UPI002A0CDB16|nr:VOC family protein [Cognatiyoonia sp. IB215182]MDX8355753.1 VOC family protein [Cognatiyoonia sp. IB215182]